MVYVHQQLLSSPEYLRYADQLFVRHLYGEANPFSDACSRGYFDLLRVMARQMNITLTQLEVPADLKLILQQTYAHYQIHRGAEP